MSHSYSHGLQRQKNIRALIIRKKEDGEGLEVTGAISTNPVMIMPPLI
jgi:hypothetical protein